MSTPYSLPPRRGPVSRFLTALVLLTVAGISFFLGLIVFLVILGVGLVAGLILYLRLRRLRRTSQAAGASPRGGVTLEGEYTVSKRDRDR